jgi:protocatechuate 3,4-dioxygenase alpha subunit
MTRIPTASQTLGPFYSYEFMRDDDPVIATTKAAGQHVTLKGRLMDKNGGPVREGLIEVWQADSEGRYAGQDSAADPEVRGFGRCLTDIEGNFAFQTIIPGASSSGGNSLQAPHFAVNVFASGLMRHVTTRIYAPGSDIADSFLDGLQDAAKALMLARSSRGADGQQVLEADIRLGDEGGTPSFEE